MSEEPYLSEEHRARLRASAPENRNQTTVKQGPRIYNLFPLLAGSGRDWEALLPRIADLGFTWVFLNPFHYPGFSGSLYAVKDYYRLHPMFQGHRSKTPDALPGEFLRQAEGHGLAVMMDLVINHTAKDSVLVAESWATSGSRGCVTCSPPSSRPG